MIKIDKSKSQLITLRTNVCIQRLIGRKHLSKSLTEVTLTARAAGAGQSHLSTELTGRAGETVRATVQVCLVTERAQGTGEL